MEARSPETADGAFGPAALQPLPQPLPRTLEITLRQGVFFPPGPPFNGREFTADDLVYTAKVQWPRSTLVLSPQVKLRSVEKTDKYTVRFLLDEPFADLAESLLENGRAPVIGPELFDKDNSVNVAEQAALGPFRVAKYRPGVAMDFLRNDSHWRKDVPSTGPIRRRPLFVQLTT